MKSRKIMTFEMSTVLTSPFTDDTTQPPKLEEWPDGLHMQMSSIFILVISATILLLIWLVVILFYFGHRPKRRNIEITRQQSTTQSNSSDLPPKYETALNLQRFPSVEFTIDINNKDHQQSHLNEDEVIQVEMDTLPPPNYQEILSNNNIEDVEPQQQLPPHSTIYDLDFMSTRAVQTEDKSNFSSFEGMAKFK